MHIWCLHAINYIYNFQEHSSSVYGLHIRLLLGLADGKKDVRLYSNPFHTTFYTMHSYSNISVSCCNSYM